MRGKLPDVVKLPPSVTVPFSSFEEALKQKDNKPVAKLLEAAVKAIPQTNAEEKLRECRDIVMEACRRPYSDLYSVCGEVLLLYDCVPDCEDERNGCSLSAGMASTIASRRLQGHGCILTHCEGTHRWLFQQSWRSS